MTQLQGQDPRPETLLAPKLASTSSVRLPIQHQTIFIGALHITSMGVLTRRILFGLLAASLTTTAATILGYRARKKDWHFDVLVWRYQYRYCGHGVMEDTDEKIDKEIDGYEIKQGNSSVEATGRNTAGQHAIRDLHVMGRRPDIWSICHGLVAARGLQAAHGSPLRDTGILWPLQADRIRGLGLYRQRHQRESTSKRRKDADLVFGARLTIACRSMCRVLAATAFGHRVRRAICSSHATRAKGSMVPIGLWLFSS